MRAWVAKYIGIPFRSHGRGPDAYDCWGLVRRILKEEFGRDLPDFSDLYVGSGDKRGIPSAFSQGTIQEGWGKVDTEQEGDLAILLIAGRPMHCGLVVGDGKMIHARTGTGSCIEPYRGPVWNRRIEGFYRPRA